MHQHKIPVKRQRARAGSILVLVLIVLSSLVALSAGLAYRTRIEMRLTYAAARRVQAHHLALGGIERVRAHLKEAELSPERAAAVCCFRETANQEQLFEQTSTHASDSLHLRYAICDEQGYLDVNKSDPAVWVRIPGISPECVAAIVDWTDPDDNTGLGGAETAYYARLPTPYAAKNRPCATLRELLYVHGITYSRYLGLDPSGDGPWDRNEAGSWLEHSTPSIVEAAVPGLVNVFTVFGDGRININTARPDILAVLPGLDETVAHAIRAFRAGADARLGTNDDQTLLSAEDIANVRGLSKLQIDLLSEYGCFESQYFRVFSQVDSDQGALCCLAASIQVSEGTPSVLTLEQLF
jgi:type II secretory pathway component PulK